MLNFIEDFLLTLAQIPGLKFLESYMNQIRTRRTQFDQDLGDKMAQKDSTLAAYKKVKNLPKNMKGSKKKR
ncbi:hypothetical protein N9B60_00510 [Mariniblastus sp.]|nr:hypothetical protein [Mariniblastus sp.]